MFYSNKILGKSAIYAAAVALICGLVLAYWYAEEARAAAANAPIVPKASTLEDTMTTLKIMPDAADAAVVTHFRITGITGGTLYKNDGTTEIIDGSYITAQEGEDGLRFMPAQDLNSTAGDRFSFTVQAALDATGTGLSPGTDAEIVVYEVNDAPTAADDDLPAVLEDSEPLTIPFATLLVNDSAGPNETLQSLLITKVDGAIGGSAEISGTDIIFTPDANFHGQASFSYTVMDNGTTNGVPNPKTDKATVRFRIHPTADAPNVTKATTAEDTMTQSGLVITPNVADGAEVTHYRITWITGGTLYKNDGKTEITDGSYITEAEGGKGLRFMPAPDLNTPAGDTFSITVQAALDAAGTGLSPGTVADITVTEVNDPPIAENDVLPAIEANSGPLTIPFADLLANDSPGPNESGDMTIASVSRIAGGSVMIVGSNVIFTPDDDFFGEASFMYMVSDKGTTNGASDPKTSVAPATVKFTVNPWTAKAPSVTPASTSEDTMTTTGLVITPDAVDGATVTHYRITGITGGTLYKNDGTTEITDGSYITATEGGAGLRFVPAPDLNTPAGDSFGFTVQAALNGAGAGLSPGTVASIAVTEVNDAPVAVDDNLSTVRDGEGVRTIAIASLLANDSPGPANEQGQSLSIIDVSNPVGGTVAITGEDIVFTPTPGYLGIVSFDYTLQDDGTTGAVSSPLSDTGSVSYKIDPSSLLSDLIVKDAGNPLELEPKFDPQVNAYTLSVRHQVSELVLVPVAVSGAAVEIEVNGNRTVSGDDSQAIALQVGSNTIDVTVEASGYPLMSYTIQVTRGSPPSNPPSNPPSSPPGYPVYSPKRQASVVTDQTAGESIVVQIDINRTTHPNGTVTDSVILERDAARRIVEEAKARNAQQIIIRIDDDSNRPADAVEVTIPPASVRILAEAGLELVIQAAGAAIVVPHESVQSLSSEEDPLFFRIAPILEGPEQDEVKERIAASSELAAVVQGHRADVIGRPVKIETNDFNRRTILTLPIDRSAVPSSPEPRDAFLNGLFVFVEHSDGERVVKSGTLKFDNNGNDTGIEIEVDKFSTFSVIRIPKVYNKYINGYPDGTFRPEEGVTRAELAVMLHQLLDPQIAPETQRQIFYHDVTDKHWAYEAIAAMQKQGLMIGDPQGNFNPNDKVSRAELAAIVARWKGLGGVEGDTMPFPDIEGHWAQRAILAANAAGFMKGYPDGFFQPDKPLTRAEAVRVLNLMTDRPYPSPDKMTAWKDVPSTYWGYRDIGSASTAFE